jgi:hypothetical protein
MKKHVNNHQKLSLDIAHAIRLPFIFDDSFKPFPRSSSSACIISPLPIIFALPVYL